jgi:hypothetical protein
MMKAQLLLSTKAGRALTTRHLCSIGYRWQQMRHAMLCAYWKIALWRLTCVHPYVHLWHDYN